MKGSTEINPLDSTGPPIIQKIPPAAHKMLSEVLSVVSLSSLLLFSQELRKAQQQYLLESNEGQADKRLTEAHNHSIKLASALVEKAIVQM